MLVLSLFLILVSGCGLVVGNSLLAWFDPSSCFDRCGDRVIVSIWIGVLALANLYLAISLFTPLSPSVTIPAALLLLGVSLWPRQARRTLGALLNLFTPSTLIGSLALILGVSAYCSQVIVWYDTGLYHYQVINWLSEYGLVPGLALIHSRLGCTSSWSAFSAIFDHGMLEGRLAALPNALCLLLMLAHAIIACMRVVSYRARSQDLFIVAAYLLSIFIVLLIGMPNSTSPDFPLIVLTIIMAWSILAISYQKESSGGHELTALSAYIPLILAAGAVSIKLSALPLLAVACCFYFFRVRPNAKKFATTACSVFTALIPIALSGFVSSGCIFYPASALCVDVPWSLGAAKAETETKIILEGNRWGGDAPDYATAWNWVLPWVGREKIFAALIFISILAVIILILSRSTDQPGKCYIMTLGVVGIVFIIYAAPGLRFGLGYLVLLPSLVAASHQKIPMKIAKYLKKIGWFENFCFLCMSTAVLIVSHINVIARPSYALLDKAVSSNIVVNNDNPHFNLLLPPSIWNIGYELSETNGETVAFKNLIIEDRCEDFTYFRPEDTYRSDLCWDAPLPCSIMNLENVKLRQPDKGIAGGFEKIGDGPPLR